MDDLNQTSPDIFILLGLSDVPYLQVICFLMFLLMYICTGVHNNITMLSGNLLMIIIVRISPKLHNPMYFFLSNLSTIDVGFSSSTVPIILKNTISKDRSISLLECAIQMYFNLALGVAECIMLAVMAYDRFAAICKPLYYNIIMTKKLCFCLAAGSWSVGFINSIIHVALTFQLPFCRSHHVNHFFCEVPPFLRLSCGDTLLNEIAVYISAVIIAVSAFLLTLISYVHIISTILKIRYSQGRYKAFSTCASHLIVVTLFYGTSIVLYLQFQSSHSHEIDKIVSIVYTAVTPMLNPFIYSVRNKDVKETIINSLSRKQNL
ncbi:olfactory receptor 5V1-like [Pseudophryne corroboree]|uniref:olfactory receptor 5V1-like n=1 Tax=Pseudophryne corroboree TaxID=495146 RepID=UPI0030813B77